MTIELVPLAQARLKLGAPNMMPKGPKGTRMVVDIVSATWEGERLNAKQAKGPSGDWALVGSDGTLFVDVRATLETHDGALILVTYNGRADYSQGSPEAIYGAPTFETSDARYLWLNKVQAVAKGKSDGAGGLVYDIFEVR
ncbi:MAG: DUF3237 domain-containing protein [Pseudomonadota bacterium]